MNTKTPISALQELMAARKLPLPLYIEEGFGVSFKCTVHAAGITAVGLASNKKSAKHKSAQNALDILGAATKVPTIVLVERPVVVEKPLRNYVGELNEFSSKRGVKYPDYGDVTVTVQGEFYIKCSFIEKETFGKGMNKKDAKQNAAKNMLEIVSVMDPVKIVTNVIQTKVEVSQKEKIITMYEALSLCDEKKVFDKKDELQAIPEIRLIPEDSVNALKIKLQKHGIEYTLEDFQTRPYIIMLRIKGTNLHFAATANTREEATKQVLQDVLEAAKTGISSNTDDLISFSS